MKLEIYYPVLDDKNKIANIAITRQFVNDTKIELIGKSSVAFLVIENLSNHVQLLEIVGKTVEIPQGVSAINITNIKEVEFNRIFDGYIYAIGEYRYE